MIQATERLWRTAEGGLVRDGDEAGEFLAYAPGAVVHPKDEALMPGDKPRTGPEQAMEPDSEPEPKPVRAKAAAKPADKQAAKPDNK